MAAAIGEATDNTLRAEGLELARGDLFLGVTLSLQAGPGARVVLTAPSGVGKSTALRTLVGFETARAGAITFGGETPDAIGWPAYRRSVMYVQQSPGLFRGTVADNLRRPFEYGIRGDERFDEPGARRLLDSVGLADCWGRDVRTLSGGEKTRLGLVRALNLTPSILLADEPSAGLDAAAAAVVAGVLAAYCANGLGLVVVSHDEAFLAQVEPTATIELTREH